MCAKRKEAQMPDYAVAPGRTIKETMEDLSMSQKEFAIRLGITEQSLIRIFKGEQPVTYETADKLELVTGVPARFWNNYEALYRAQLLRIEEKEQLASDLEWLSHIPVNELIKRGFIKPYKDSMEQFRSVLSFFGVGSVKSWHDYWAAPQIATRRSSCFSTNPYAAATWIRMGELQAKNMDCKPYNGATFLKNLHKIRSLTLQEPKEFCPTLTKLCAESGVALALVPEMKNVPWSGATEWLSKDKILIMLNLRGKKEDRFWFSFFHEAGHVMLHDKRDVFINDQDDRNDPREVEADDFASDMLIPTEYRDQIPLMKTENDVNILAKQIGIAPGIVAGHYQHATNQWSKFNNIIRKFVWTCVN